MNLSLLVAGEKERKKERKPDGAEKKTCVPYVESEKSLSMASVEILVGI